MDEVLEEQKYVIQIIAQMKEIHRENKSVVSTLEFLEDCVSNRMVETDD